MKIRKDLTNQKFGRLTALTPFRNGKYTMWHCQCDCGNTCDVVGTSLSRGMTKSCGCIRKEKVTSKNKVNSGRYGDISASYFNQVKRNANKRKLDFEITIEQVWDKFVSQKGKCALTGIDISFVESDLGEESFRTGRKHSASLDRIDSSLGYTKNNIQWVDQRINIMKNNHPESDFIKLCEMVTDYANSRTQCC